MWSAQNRGFEALSRQYLRALPVSSAEHSLPYDVVVTRADHFVDCAFKRRPPPPRCADLTLEVAMFVPVNFEHLAPHSVIRHCSVKQTHAGSSHTGGGQGRGQLRTIRVSTSSLVVAQHREEKPSHPTSKATTCQPQIPFHLHVQS